MESYGQWFLVKRHERAGARKLRVLENSHHSAGAYLNEAGRVVKLREFEYVIDETDPFYVEKGEVRQSSLTVTLESPVCGKYEVKNWSIKAAMAYYLSHQDEIEVWLKANPWPTLDELLKVPDGKYVGSGI